MTMVGGLDVHRQQITFDYVDWRAGHSRPWMPGVPVLTECQFAAVMKVLAEQAVQKKRLELFTHSDADWREWMA